MEANETSASETDVVEEEDGEEDEEDDVDRETVEVELSELLDVLDNDLARQLALASRAHAKEERDLGKRRAATLDIELESNLETDGRHILAALEDVGAKTKEARHGIRERREWPGEHAGALRDDAAVQRPALVDTAVTAITRAEDKLDILLVECPQQLRRHLGWVLQVGVHAHEKVTGRGIETSNHGRGETALRRADNDADIVALLDELLHLLLRAIARVIVDEDELYIVLVERARVGERSKEARGEGLDIGDLFVSGHNDRAPHRRRRAVRTPLRRHYLDDATQPPHKQQHGSKVVHRDDNAGK